MTLQRPAAKASMALIASISLAAVYLWRRTRRRQLKQPQICSAYEKLIGATPMVKLDFLSHRIGRSIYLKMENMNPGGTGKDRAALCMIQHAEASGQLPTPMLGRNRNQSRFQCLNEGNDDTDTTSENEDILGSLSSLQQAIQFAMKRSQSGGLVIEGTRVPLNLLATLCAARGHACLVVLPDDQAPEKKRILKY
ncbi:pyridoxal-phosphate dependent enzyme [Fragilaria crotonensis]|nr:pyridoxal-phosphate dependent enzyme [Fragilaria crotonensis]